MNLLKIAWRSIQFRSLASSLTGLSMALGVALVVTVLVIYGAIQDSFTKGAYGYHLVVGKKGSDLQLVLNTVYHLEKPNEPLPYTYYQEFLKTPEKRGRFSGYVETVIPYCLGDNYQGYRVVGTTPEVFTVEYSRGKAYEFDQGENFKADEYYEAVIGSEVAQKTGLKLGDTFEPSHGITEEAGHKHDPFKIVGVLRRTGTANDRALFINIEGFYLLDKHAKPVDEARQLQLETERAKGALEKGVLNNGADKKGPAGHDADEHAHDEHGHDEKDADGHDAAEHAHDEIASNGHAHDEHGHDEHDHDEKDAAGHAHDEHGHDEDSHSHPGESGSDSHKQDAHTDLHDHSPAKGDAHSHEGEGEEGHSHEGHDHHDHAPLPIEQREVTSLLVRAKNDTLAFQLQSKLNEGVEAMAVSPVRVIQGFLNTFVKNISMILIALAILIVIEAGVGILVSIYNSMNDRRREIAIMRSLGAGRGTVLSIILLESVLLSILGCGLGFLLGHGILGLVSPLVESYAGISIGFFKFHWLEWFIIPAVVVLASLVGIVPALNAYRTDVAKALTSGA